MKQRSLLLFLVSLMALFPAYAEDTGNLSFKGNGNSVSITDVGNGEWVVQVKGDDPYAYLYPLEADLTEEQNTVKFEYKLNKETGTGVEFFFSPIQGGREQSFSLIPTDQWTLAQINIAT